MLTLLQDMLDEFSAVKLNKKPEAAASASPAPAASASDSTSTAKPAAGPTSGFQPSVDDEFSEEDFAKQLQAGMADLLGELDKSVGGVCCLLMIVTRY